MKKIKVLSISLIMALAICGCARQNESINTDTDEEKDYKVITLNNTSAEVDGESIDEYNYIWSFNRETGKEEYEGDVPEGNIYISHDVIYYPEIPEEDFSLEDYNGEREWVAHYTGENSEYLYSTLPQLGESIPLEMMHSSREAYDNPVLHINEEGTYLLKGTWHGQINIDLGEDANTDETKKVTLILDGVNVTCDVAPALIFKNVYEADNNWKDRESYSNDVNIDEAGAKVIINDGTENSFTGANVFRLLKPEYKKEGSTVQKKLYKTDGAFYSYMSMIIEGSDKGTGILNITSTSYEGLNSELHLQINSGYINIVSNDDGINVNEDDVSVFRMNGGRLTIFAGQGREGDVIDSNGYIVVNGGTILGTSPSVSDNLLDSDAGTSVSDEATLIAGGAMNTNNGFDHGPMFKPDKMPEGFEPGRRPDDFNREDRFNPNEEN